MLGKVITLNKTARSSAGFSPVVRYLFRDGPEHDHEDLKANIEGGVINLDADLTTPEDRQILAELLHTTARRNTRFRGNPVYHLALSWHAGEHPTKDQIRQSVTHLMTTLKMAECEAVYAVHRDTDHDHVHLVVNRIHPVKNTVAGPPQFDYFHIDQACRELELQHGWAHDPGPYIVTPGPEGRPQVRRQTKAEWAQWKAQRGRPPSRRAQRAAHNQAVPSFQTWVAGSPAKAVRYLVHRPYTTWADVHRVLADYGVTLQSTDHGIVVTTTVPEGRRLTAKATHLGRDLHTQRLLQHFGPWVTPYPPGPPATETYAAFVARIQRGEARSPEPGHRTESPHDTQRALRRAERARARWALVDRFKAEQTALKTRRRQLRKEMTDRHRRERDALRADLAARRIPFRAEQTAAGVPPKLTRALWAFTAAQEREQLQKRHADERRQTRNLPRSQVWRTWLEQQAGQGDAAAQAALRGIRYQEQRNKHKTRNGIEGEEREPLQSVLSSLHAEVDRQRQRVQYRDDTGRLLFTDTGPRIEVHDQTESTLEAALRVAAQKFGGSVDITGSADFRAQAARTAARLGITVRDPDLQSLWREERQRVIAPRRPVPPRPMPERQPERDDGMER
ncbi:MAG: TraI/MobA(P) family conjugative relaxase [Acidiferrobacteraceae bacterium]